MKSEFAKQFVSYFNANKNEPKPIFPSYVLDGLALRIANVVKSYA